MRHPTVLRDKLDTHKLTSMSTLSHTYFFIASARIMAQEAGTNFSIRFIMQQGAGIRQNCPVSVYLSDRSLENSKKSNGDTLAGLLMGPNPRDM